MESVEVADASSKQAVEPTFMKVITAPVTRLLRKNKIVLSIYGFIGGFMTYFAMYGFRKSFTSYDYEGLEIWGVQYKIMIVTLQVIGYTLSKFAGIKIVSEMGERWRGMWILLFVGIAELALIGFGAVPTPYNAIFMFINGLPLGMIWGIVFSFLEGRTASEILGCGMCVSFIISSGIVKSVATSLIEERGVDPYWAPAATGAIFAFPLLLGVYMLESLPEPDEEDIRSRAERVPMTNAERIKFLKLFWPGITVITIFYMLLTAYRDFRDNFAPELWVAFGYEETPSIFSTSELIVAVCVCVPIGLFLFFKKKIHVFIAYHVLICAGFVLVAIVTAIFNGDGMDGMPFMVITGIGLYVGYVPFNSILFDLLLATFKYNANSGFLMYLCDSMGYLSAVVIMFVKNFALPDLSWKDFYIAISYGLAIVDGILIILSLVYFMIRYRGWNIVDDMVLSEGAGKGKGSSDDDDDDDEEKVVVESAPESGSSNKVNGADDQEDKAAEEVKDET